MEIQVSNLANINQSEYIKIKNFNIFIGKNGTGKTYYAKLIYFIHSNPDMSTIFEKTYSAKLTKAFKDKEPFIITTDENTNFLKELRNNIKNKFPEWVGGNKELFKKFNFALKVQAPELNFQCIETDNMTDFIRINTLNYIELIFGRIEAHYLPAARANYMITYKYLFDSIYTNLRDVLLNKPTGRLSILPEIENKFLRDIYRVDTKIHGDLFSLGNKIEKEIFKNGKLSIKNPKSQDLPTYEYKLNDTKTNLELVAASSAVSEISPLIMYLKHKIDKAKYATLVFDEPELSLHPEAQAKLVALLIEAVNKGLKIILVTHSPYILEAVNNHLQKHKIKDYDLPKEIKNIESLNPEETGVYLFEDNNIKNILDEETKLIDDKLLQTFNNLNNKYDQMRDIEWENK